MILPAIPSFIEKFDISYSTTSWLLSAYIIAAAVMTPISGKISDMHDRKKVLLTVIAIGMTLLFALIVMSSGPVITGILQDTYQSTVNGVAGAFLADFAYVMIFSMAATVSAALFGIAVKHEKTRWVRLNHPQIFLLQLRDGRALFCYFSFCPGWFFSSDSLSYLSLFL